MFTIIHCGSGKTPAIASLLDALGYDNRIVNSDDFNYPAYEDSVGFIIGGNPLLLTENDHKPLFKKFQFLKITEIPVLGICFGMLITGMLFGSEIKRCPEYRSDRSISVLQQNALFENLPPKPVFKEDHTEEITLPEEFICLAKSDACEVEAMQHQEKKIFGVQFHPEVSGENGKALLDNFCKTFLP